MRSIDRLESRLFKLIDNCGCALAFVPRRFSGVFIRGFPPNKKTTRQRTTQIIGFLRWGFRPCWAGSPEGRRADQLPSTLKTIHLNGGGFKPRSHSFCSLLKVIFLTGLQVHGRIVDCVNFMKIYKQ